MTKNQKAFLDMIAYSEGTSTSKATRNNGYDVIVTGVNGKPEIFTDYSTHPFMKRLPKEINLHGLHSTASGRYQFLKKDWLHYQILLKLFDFGPKYQDKWALHLLRECGALPKIDKGDFETAILKCSHLWASLPGANYQQHENKLDVLLAFYKASGGLTTST
jgi:muramidase (phage lysozyme)